MGEGEKNREEGRRNVDEVETDWVMLKKRTQQRRQPGDEASMKSDGRKFRVIQILMKADGSGKVSEVVKSDSEQRV